MTTNLALDDALLLQAMATGNFKTKKETVTVALEEFIQRREMKKVVELFGTIDYEVNYDYKALRKMR